MHFSRPSIDESLLSELLAQGVVTQALWNSLPLPDEGQLVDVFIAHRERFDEERWAYWLVKRHGCLRVPGLEPDRELVASLRWPARIESHSRFFGCFPCTLRNGIAHLACVRPDLDSVAAEFLSWLGASRYYLFALTPKELKFWAGIKRQAI